ncbi:TIGR04149 family rSAM-modified RiPP [Bacteroides bouchesdurhonensis]|uniref:TIGR04149 family rSAM-modified RiPP n=1 Tax=Bacteroides bouchesdurhonensis TaxID=1841855 RepID=UPI001F3D9155|nr:TIGR04149 family rSAM-modified RiPP [Bacteroides bouchesdurhonensis]
MRLKKLKLNALSESTLKDKEMNALRGGNCCTCRIINKTQNPYMVVINIPIVMAMTMNIGQKLNMHSIN